MSYICRSINNQLKNSIFGLLLSSSSSSSSIKLFSTTTSSDKIPNLLIPKFFYSNFLKSPDSKQSLLSNARCPNLSFNFMKLKSITRSPHTTIGFNYSTRSMKRKELWVSIPVRAYCLSHRIDMIGLMAENQTNLIPHTPGIGNYVLLRFSGLTNNPSRDLRYKLSESSYSYVLVFRYGSIVMFNIPDHEVNGYMKIIEKHSSKLLQETTDGLGAFCPDYSNIAEYEVRENPNFPTWMQGGLDYIMLKHLSIDGICTIGSVLGQNAALGYYVHMVDGMVSEFSNINLGLEKNGRLTDWRKRFHICRNMRHRREAISWFGLSERFDVAWKEDNKYAQMLDYLRDKFDLAQGFAGLERKFNMGELNIYFFGWEDCRNFRMKMQYALYSCFLLLSFSPIGGLPLGFLESLLSAG